MLPAKEPACLRSPMLAVVDNGGPYNLSLLTEIIAGVQGRDDQLCSALLLLLPLSSWVPCSCRRHSSQGELHRELPWTCCMPAFALKSVKYSCNLQDADIIDFATNIECLEVS